jgi:sarcosine oxidase, subunit alpha
VRVTDSPSLFRPRAGAAREITLRWDRDRLVPAREGDTVSAALLAAGVLATSRSIKYRRHRGPYCLQGDCGTCLVRVDGGPNVRACMTPVRDGMRVEPQNRLLPVGPDPTALVDTVFFGGMDHHHLMVRPRIVNLVMQEVARGLAGLGRLPDRPRERGAIKREHAPDVLVVGAGPAGLAAATTLVRAGVGVLHVDRIDKAGLPASADRVLDATAVFGVYPQERLWAATTRAPGAAEVLHVISPRHVVIATGARSPMIPLPGNDIPGVVSARGLLALMRRSGTQLAVPCVVVGEDSVAREAARALGVDAFDPAEVERIDGHRSVTGLRLRDGRRIACRLVALAAAPAPASELARQAGARVRWSEGGFAVERDETGRCTATGPWQLWAAGDVCGTMGPDEARRDGRRIGNAVAAACRGDERP